MKTLQVEYVKPETIETKFGPKQKYSIKDSDGTWYSSWDREMSNVKQGDTITGTVTSREYNGKTYYDFKKLSNELVDVYKEMKRLGERIAALEGDRDDHYSYNDMKGEESTNDEISVEDIPF